MAASTSEDVMNATSSRIQTCIFCNQVDDERKYGKMLSKDGITAHNFCLLFSSGLAQKGEDHEGLVGFLPDDIRKEKYRSRSLKCSYCKHRSASIGCAMPRCKKSFHYGCGKDNGVMYLYMENFRSHCVSHRGQQQDLSSMERAKLKTKSVDDCCICFEPLTTEISNDTILSPCCTRAWYHRTCLDNMAYSAGLHFFKCPLCNNVEEWQLAMLQAGIYIPDRDASWELEPDAYNSLLEISAECDAEKCLCPKGRAEDKDHSIWELILCDSCGSQACHVACGKLKRKDKQWLCNVCRNVTTSPGPARENNMLFPPESSPKMPKRMDETARRRDRLAGSSRQREIQEVTNILATSSTG